MVMTSCLCCGQNFIHETKIITIQLAYSKKLFRKRFDCYSPVIVIVYMAKKVFF